MSGPVDLLPRDDQSAPEPQAMARALVREAVIMAGSCLSRPGPERLMGWILRYLETLVDNDGNAEAALTQAGLAAALAVQHHGRYDAYFEPLVSAELEEAE